MRENFFDFFSKKMLDGSDKLTYKLRTCSDERQGKPEKKEIKI